MSPKLTDCSICFNSQNCFKVLQCGHNFCQNCCVDMMKSNNETPSKFRILCPLCQKTTEWNGDVEGLRNRFVGSLQCYQCDTEKSILNFRFCLICSRSVCSTCFVDRHHNNDGQGFHKSVQWEDLMGVKRVVEQLQQISLESQLITDKCKTDVEIYLDGLKRHFWGKIEHSSSENQSVLLHEVNRLINSFGLDRRSLQPAKHMSDDHFGYLLKDVKKVALLSGDIAHQRVTQLQPYPYDLFEPIFLSRTSQPNNPYCLDPEKLQNRFINTKLIGSDLIKIPWDVVAIDGRLVILDLNLGPFVQSSSTFNPIALQFQYDSFLQIVKVPDTDTLLVTAETDESDASDVYFLLTWDNVTSEYQHFKFPNDKYHQTLPVNYNRIFASATNIYFLTLTALFRFDLTGKMSFNQIYSSLKESNLHEWLIGDVQEFGNVTEFYFTNKQWKSIDILQMTGDCVTQIRRVNLILLSPYLESLVDPMISRYFINGYYLMWNWESTILYLWNVEANTCDQIVDFRSKKLCWIKIFGRQMFLVTKSQDQYSLGQIDLSTS